MEDKAFEVLKRRIALLSVDQVAAIAGVSRQTVKRMIDEKTLPAILIRSGKRKHVFKIRAVVLERWILSREKRSQAVTKENPTNGDQKNGS